MLTGHDNQLASVGGLINVSWQLPGFAQNDTPPGGAFVFELFRRPDSSYAVRVYYISQTMEQMHDATPLTLQNGPAVAPIFVPGVRTNTPYFDCRSLRSMQWSITPPDFNLRIKSLFPAG